MLDIQHYPWHQAPESVRHLRKEVFIHEQGVPEGLEWDDTDAIAEHFLASDEHGEPVAVARLFPAITDTARLGRMAVRAHYRGQGYGSLLLKHLMRYAAEDYRILELSAQESAVPFYQRHGFHVCSAPYMDAGIPHLDMRCLAPDRPVEDAAPEALQPLILGNDDSTWLVEGARQWQDMARSLCGQARQRVWIYDRLLEPELYDDECLRDLLSASHVVTG